MGIKNNEAVVSRKDMMMINPEMIVVTKEWNPRTEFDIAKLNELKNSIIQHGVLTPIRVKITQEDTFVLIDGERRLRATLMAIKSGNPIKSIPALVERKTIKPEKMLILAMTTNNGVPLTPMEESEAMSRLVEYGLTVKEIATKLGHSVAFIKGRINLQNATDEVKEMLENKEIGIADVQDVINASNGDKTEQNNKATIKKVMKKVKVKKASRKELFELLEEISEDLKEFTTEFPQLKRYINKIKVVADIEQL